MAQPIATQELPVEIPQCSATTTFKLNIAVEDLVRAPDVSIHSTISLLGVEASLGDERCQDQCYDFATLPATWRDIVEKMPAKAARAGWTLRSPEGGCRGR